MAAVRSSEAFIEAALERQRQLKDALRGRRQAAHEAKRALDEVRGFSDRLYQGGACGLEWRREAAWRGKGDARCGTGPGSI